MIPRTYDQWLQSNPEDEWLGDDPAERDPDEERERQGDDALWDKQTSTDLEAHWGHQQPTWCEFLDRKGVTNYNTMSDADKWKLSREWDGRSDGSFLPTLDINALDLEERSVDEKLNDDAMWDEHNAEGNWRKRWENT